MRISDWSSDVCSSDLDQRRVPHLMSEHAAAPRKCIEVAAGCLVDADGRVLIAQRPVGKIAAGQWEFPGGKIETGESAHDALVRELREEIGIEVRDARDRTSVV